MLINLTDNRKITNTETKSYVLPAPKPSRVCGTIAPEFPFYRCTRGYDHQHGESHLPNFHAAHVGTGDKGAMVALWVDENRREYLSDEERELVTSIINRSGKD